MSDPLEVLGHLADPARLRVFAALVLGGGSTEDVAATAGASPKDAVRVLARLEQAGLARRAASGWEAVPGALQQVVAAATPERDVVGLEDASPSEAAVLRAFMPAGRLEQVPASRSKRLVVLDHVARVFEVGVRYPEAEVDVLLRAFHPDHAALRRYLVDEGLLSREQGVYWRTGGTVDV